MANRFKSAQRRLFAANVAIIVFAIVAMSSVCLYSVARDLTDDRTFAHGITVNNLNLSGMTFSDARRILIKNGQDELSHISMELLCGGKSYTLTAEELGAEINVDDTLELAFSIGKTGSESSNAALGLGVGSISNNFITDIVVDKVALASCVREIAEEFDVEFENATAEFDAEGRSFTYNDGKQGFVVDAEKAIDEIAKRLANHDYSTYELPTHIVEPEVTRQELEDNTKLLSHFTSNMTKNRNRNVNIQLMCDYVVSYGAIMPGEVFSINEWVGERTEEKGFLPAPAIMDGKYLQDDIGGGICQLSGTLYNAALRANMDIVERLPHSWPSDYLEKGLDSTLDWNSQKDLKLRNTSDYPIYIAAWLKYDNLDSANVLNVAIYGQPLPEGVTIEIRTEILEEIDPGPDKVTVVSSLAAGKREVKVTRRIGYRINAWRDFYYNGVLIDSEPMSSSYYKPIQGEVWVGKSSSGTGGSNSGGSNTNPSPTPSPTPAPEESLPVPEDTPTSLGNN